MKIEIPAAKKLVYETVIPIRWGDMDAMGHVNNTLYFRYFETIRIDWFRKIGAVPGPQGVGPVIVNAFCNFLRQLEFPGDIRVALFVANPGRSSFDTYHTIERTDEPPAAFGQAYIVQVQVPPPSMNSVTEIGVIPVRAPAGMGPPSTGHATDSRRDAVERRGSWDDKMTEADSHDAAPLPQSVETAAGAGTEAAAATVSAASQAPAPNIGSCIVERPHQKGRERCAKLGTTRRDARDDRSPYVCFARGKCISQRRRLIGFVQQNKRIERRHAHASDRVGQCGHGRRPRQRRSLANRRQISDGSAPHVGRACGARIGDRRADRHQPAPCRA